MKTTSSISAAFLLLGLIVPFAAAIAADQAPPEHDRNATITHEQFIQHAEEHFKKMDTNHDGAISPDERKAAHEQMREKRKEWNEKRSKDSAPAK